MNGRNFEYFGEDPFLGARIAVGYIDGVQAEGVSATIKHYLGNNSEYARFTSDSIIDERTMREIYMPIFEAAVKEAHVGSIMDSYNLTNGQHMTQNGYLNTTVAKEQWGFDGLMMSDWTATKDAVKAVNGGLDLEMPFPQYMNRENLLPAVKSGQVSEATIDDHVRRLLRVAIRFGWLDHPQLDLGVARYNQQGVQAALDGALEGAVLLKNDGALLPLNKQSLHNIAVIGPNAFPGSATAGGSGEVPSFNTISAMRGLSDALAGTAVVTYARGIPTLHQLAAATQFTQDAEGKKPGVLVETFPALSISEKAESTRTERSIDYGKPGLGDTEDVEALATMTQADFTSLLGSGNTPHAKRWTGYYTPRIAGTYTLFMETSENYRVLVDDKVLIDSSEIPRALLTTAHIKLTAHPHKIVLEELSATAFGIAFGRLGIADESTLVQDYAKQLAAKADAVVLAVGFNAEIESEGSDREFGLPIGQNELIREIAKINPKTVVVVTSGGAVDVAPWIASVPALLETWYPGQEGGTALAKLLLGDANPSGHLPISWDRNEKQNPSAAFYYTAPGSHEVAYKEGIFTGYRGYEHAHVKPMFPFGFGLSYTTFRFDHLKVSPGSQPHSYLVTYDITNTGARDGAMSSQVYVGEQHPSVARPVKELKGFARVTLKAGETQQVSVELGARAFTFYDVAKKQWQADAGTYTVSVGDSSDNTPLHEDIRMTEAFSQPN
jgi:beta-glucosidase